MGSTNYTDDNIKTLEWNEHIRKRAGMYIGRLGNGDNPGDGIYVLLKEIIDNSVDEFTMGFGKLIKVSIDNLNVSVRDYGRGIPLDSVVKVTSQLNTGGKFDDVAFKKSVGLNGVGTKAVNALSSSFYIASFRDGESSWAKYSKGILLDRGKEETSEKDGTYVLFTPDAEMFGDFSFNNDYVITLVKNYSYLKKGLTLDFNGEEFRSENGLLDMVSENMSEPSLYPLIHLEGDDIEIVMTHGNSYGENISSFVNGQNTRDGGTHLSAFREAVAKTLKDFYKKNYSPEDIRQGIVGAISIQIQEPNFEGQTKTKLGSTYMYRKDGNDGPTIRSFVNDFISKNLDNYLRIHTDIVPLIEDKIKASKAEREEISGIQKKTRERNRKSNIYNEKLRDCRYHYNDKLPESKRDIAEKTSIFITEGNSASGTITKVRNAGTQAVFSLRGKPINCYKESHKKVAENVELNLLVSALGVEDELDDLRYNNIIVATDADDDGMHIRMLVLTFFMKYYPDLIRRGHVHILQTPLFRVRNKKEIRYCYSPVEKEKAIAELKKDLQITRFKGLGEISPDEFVDFIGDGMRLDSVKLSDEESISEILEFYMGDNTMDRQNFIREHLRSEEELEDVNI
ncbi:MAG: toprim domain-containing protein [Bacteroidales bacterium]|jgi:topoisomerase-4 subunit B|nr:toprim domain-containing protein [Bacteroidales bacterium]